MLYHMYNMKLLRMFKFIEKSNIKWFKNLDMLSLCINLYQFQKTDVSVVGTAVRVKKTCMYWCTIFNELWFMNSKSVYIAKRFVSYY